MKKLYYHSNQFYVIEAPEEPKDFPTQIAYDIDLKSCIAAKKRVENIEILKTYDVNRVAFFLNERLWSQISNSLKDGSILDIPSNMEVEIERKCKVNCWDCTNGCQGEQVARLKLKEEVKPSVPNMSSNGLESLTTVKQPSPESQDDLWNSLMEQWHDVSLNMQEPHILPYLKSKFTITRKL